MLHLLAIAGLTLGLAITLRPDTPPGDPTDRFEPGTADELTPTDLPAALDERLAEIWADAATHYEQRP